MHNRKTAFAGELRPGDIVSLTGFEYDMTHVTEIQLNITNESVTLTLENEDQKQLPIDYPVVLFT